MPSTSPEFRRNVYPLNIINPESVATNVFVIEDSVVHAPLPDGYREIGDLVRKWEQDDRRGAALARARQRLGAHAEGDAKRSSLASLRLKAGLSQSRLAELLGNSQSGYSLIEAGRRDILLSTFEKLVAILNVSRDELAAAIKNTQDKAG